MKNKKSRMVFIFVIVSILIVSSIFVANNFMNKNLQQELNEKDLNSNYKVLYQGPVQVGIDEQYFRETGETKWKN